MTNTVQSAAMVLGGNGPTTVRADQTRAFEPGSIDEGFELARLLVASGLLGRNVTKPEAAFAIIATGRELGLTAMQSLRSIHIIEGKPTLSADLIAALVKSRPDVCLYFRMVESTATVARFQTHRKGEPEPTDMTFSIEDAKVAGVTGKDNWKKYPAAMLRARCITALARAVYPDLAMGLYDPDEVTPDATPVVQRVYEVEPPKAAPAPVDDAMFAKLCDRVDAAENAAALNAVASATVKAHKARQITDAHLSQLKAAVTAKREIVGAPKPPPSAPASEPPDQDPNNGAEIEEMADMVDQ
jgi:hypothetical protein